MRLSLILFLVFISVADCFSQKRGNVWCFGHYAAINFNSSIPFPDSSHTISRGSCASICDTSGSLLFYAVADTVANYAATIKGAKIFSSNHQLMQYGDSINAQGWYNEIVIVPFPGSDSLYYVFTIGVTSFYGLYYSIVDLSLNGGLGSVIQKNIQLQSFPMDDCLTTIKHGNGRDWWLLFRKTDGFGGGSNNDFYSYLITPAGVSNVNVQSVGTNNSGNTGNIIFNKEGDRFVYTNRAGMFEKYFFDRCTGVITLDTTILQEPTSNYKYFFDGELSPNGRFFYISTGPGDGHLIQFDLMANDVMASADTLWTQSSPPNPSGQLKRGPDDKIYFTCAYVPLTVPLYPYADSLYNMYNMNLSVINSPDSLGAACDFQPYSFYLGGKRTYWGLPNNPNYDMPRDSGSVCDTIQWTSVQNIEQAKGLMYVTYVSGWQKVFVNAEGLKGRSFKVSVYDMVGNVIYTEEGKLSGQYFTKDLNMAAFAKGMYIVNFVTDKERLAKKFIKD